VPAGAIHHLSHRAFDAVIFDLDGVITRTAKTHAAAWKTMFDDFLHARAMRRGERFIPFDLDADYRRYVDGKPRYDGVQSFLAARGIQLPYGEPADPPEYETVCGLGNRKNIAFLQHVRDQGVEVYDSTVALIHDLKANGFKTAVVSSSKSTDEILQAVQLGELFDTRVDGVDLQELGLKGKPEPDPFLEAASRLHVAPRRAVVVEDAIAGVEAGRRGRFGCVIGVDRTGDRAALERAGATMVIGDLAEVDVRED
jgi:alpha,alpha-trehalase